MSIGYENLAYPVNLVVSVPNFALHFIALDKPIILNNCFIFRWFQICACFGYAILNEFVV